MDTKSSTLKKTLVGMAVASILIPLVFFSYTYNRDQLINPEPAFAKITQLQGTAQQLMEQGVTAKLKIGDTIATGVKIETSPASTLTLQFADKSKLLVSENSQITMESLQRSKDTGKVETIIRMDAGVSESRVTKQPPEFKAKYRVVTPAMQLSVRGTIFRVTVDKNSGHTSSSVLEGVVAVTTDNRDMELLAGYGTIADIGKKAIKPAQLLEAPEINAVASPAQYLPLPLQWDNLSKATSYRLQLFTGINHDALIHDQIYPGNQIKLPVLADDDYLMSVRGIDAMGLEGRSSEQFFTLNAHPLPPSIKAPSSNNSRKTKLNWEPSVEAATYLIQVSRKNDFSDIISQVRNLPGSIGNITVKLSPGDYYWRVASISNTSEQGPFTLTKKFTVNDVIIK